MSVGRICTRYVDLADTEETIQAAAQRMEERKVGTLVILNPAKEPIGILTDRDLVLRALSHDGTPCETRVGAVMTRNPRTVSEAAPIEQALSLMRSGGFRRLPVVRADGTLVGLITAVYPRVAYAVEFQPGLFGLFGRPCMRSEGKPL